MQNNNEYKSKNLRSSNLKRKLNNNNNEYKKEEKTIRDGDNDSIEKQFKSLINKSNKKKKKNKKKSKKKENKKQDEKENRKSQNEEVQEEEEEGDENQAKINPIFLWVEQKDSKIISVLCEDYDKRNRIRLSKTNTGKWKAIPRTDRLVKAIAKTPWISKSEKLVNNNEDEEYTEDNDDSFESTIDDEEEIFCEYKKAVIQKAKEEENELQWCHNYCDSDTDGQLHIDESNNNVIGVLSDKQKNKQKVFLNESNNLINMVNNLMGLLEDIKTNKIKEKEEERRKRKLEKGQLFFGESCTEEKRRKSNEDNDCYSLESENTTTTNESISDETSQVSEETVFRGQTLEMETDTAKEEVVDKKEYSENKIEKTSEASPCGEGEKVEAICESRHVQYNIVNRDTNCKDNKINIKLSYSKANKIYDDKENKNEEPSLNENVDIYDFENYCEKVPSDEKKLKSNKKADKLEKSCLQNVNKKQVITNSFEASFRQFIIENDTTNYKPFGLDVRLSQTNHKNSNHCTEKRNSSQKSSTKKKRKKKKGSKKHLEQANDAFTFSESRTNQSCENSRPYSEDFGRKNENQTIEYEHTEDSQRTEDTNGENISNTNTQDSLHSNMTLNSDTLKTLLKELSDEPKEEKNVECVTKSSEEIEKNTLPIENNKEQHDVSIEQFENEFISNYDDMITEEETSDDDSDDNVSYCAVTNAWRDRSFGQNMHMNENQQMMKEKRLFDLYNKHKIPSDIASVILEQSNDKHIGLISLQNKHGEYARIIEEPSLFVNMETIENDQEQIHKHLFPADDMARIQPEFIDLETIQPEKLSEEISPAHKLYPTPTDTSKLESMEETEETIERDSRENEETHPDIEENSFNRTNESYNNIEENAMIRTNESSNNIEEDAVIRTNGFSGNIEENNVIRTNESSNNIEEDAVIRTNGFSSNIEVNPTSSTKNNEHRIKDTMEILDKTVKEIDAKRNEKDFSLSDKKPVTKPNRMSHNKLDSIINKIITNKHKVEIKDGKKEQMHNVFQKIDEVHIKSEENEVSEEIMKEIHKSPILSLDMDGYEIMEVDKDGNSIADAEYESSDKRVLDIRYVDDLKNKSNDNISSAQPWTSNEDSMPIDFLDEFCDSNNNNENELNKDSNVFNKYVKESNVPNSPVNLSADKPSEENVSGDKLHDTLKLPKETSIYAIKESEEEATMTSNNGKKDLSIIANNDNKPQEKTNVGSIKVRKTSELLISKEQTEPLDLGNHNIEKDEERRQSEKTTEEITIKSLLSKNNTNIKKLSSEEISNNEKSKLLELLTNDTDELLCRFDENLIKYSTEVHANRPKISLDGAKISGSTLDQIRSQRPVDTSQPIDQLKAILSNPNIIVPDPLLVPRSRLAALVTSPAREIPKLMSNLIDYNKMNNELLVISLNNLHKLIETTDKDDEKLIYNQQLNYLKEQIGRMGKNDKNWMKLMDGNGNDSELLQSMFSNNYDVMNPYVQTNLNPAIPAQPVQPNIDHIMQMLMLKQYNELYSNPVVKNTTVKDTPNEKDNYTKELYTFVQNNYPHYTPKEIYNTVQLIKKDMVHAKTTYASLKDTFPNHPIKEPFQSHSIKEPFQSHPIKEPFQSHPIKEPFQSHPSKEPYQSHPTKEPYQSHPSKESFQHHPIKDTFSHHPNKEMFPHNPNKVTLPNHPNKEMFNTLQQAQRESKLYPQVHKESNPYHQSLGYMNQHKKQSIQSNAYNSSQTQQRKTDRLHKTNDMVNINQQKPSIPLNPYERYYQQQQQQQLYNPLLSATLNQAPSYFKPGEHPFFNSMNMNNTNVANEQYKRMQEEYATFQQQLQLQQQNYLYQQNINHNDKHSLLKRDNRIHHSGNKTLNVHDSKLFTNAFNKEQQKTSANSSSSNENYKHGGHYESKQSTHMFKDHNIGFNNMKSNELKINNISNGLGNISPIDQNKLSNVSKQNSSMMEHSFYKTTLNDLKNKTNDNNNNQKQTESLNESNRMKKDQDRTTPTASTTPKLKIKSNIIDTTTKPKLLKIADHLDSINSVPPIFHHPFANMNPLMYPGVGIEPPLEDVHPYLWHPLFGNQEKPYRTNNGEAPPAGVGGSKWPWTTPVSINK